MSTRTDDQIDHNPRPLKRQRVDVCDMQDTALAPLPPPTLLLALPGLVAHPPTSALHAQALALSYSSFKRCLEFKSLSPDVECRAWTGLAEVGVNAIDGRFNENKEHTWADGIEEEVEKAISKGLLLAQRHPSLRIYRLHLQLLHARFALWQTNHKHARNTLRRLLSSSLPSDPPVYIYAANLTLIHHLLSTPSPATTSPVPNPSAADISTALNTVQTLQALAKSNGDNQVVILALIIRLGILVARGLWIDVPAALTATEEALGLSYATPSLTGKTNSIIRSSSDVSFKSANASTAVVGGLQASDTGSVARNSSMISTSSGVSSNGVRRTSPSASTETNLEAAKSGTFVMFTDPFEGFAAIHLLILSIVYHTHVGDSTQSSPRLQHLHALLDSGAATRFSSGIGHISLSRGQPLQFWATHPRVLYALGFLVSAISKRDAMGRKPKRQTFSAAGLEALESGDGPVLDLPVWASAGDLDEVGYRLARIKADLLSELAGISIMRSDFDVAENALNDLIAHTRSYDLFARYAPRISLHHAHLAHALGAHHRALQCYDVAVHAAEQGSAGAEGDFIAAAARAGGVLLRIGLSDGDLDKELLSDARDAVDACSGMGGSLEVLGAVLESFLASEILKSKQHLRRALDLATRMQDNHSRALILALLSSNYMHIDPIYANEVLTVADHLGSGIGAPAHKDAPGHMLGNAPLRLWIGEHRAELYRRAEKKARAEKQTKTNALFRDAVQKLIQRGSTVA